MRKIRIFTDKDEIVFGREGYLLHYYTPGTPSLTEQRREVTLIGYILPSGEDAASRAAAIESMLRRVSRIVSSPSGFTLADGEKTLHLTAEEGAELAADAPFTGTDAARFTVRARADSASFSAPEATLVSRSDAGRLVFPLAVTAYTVFAESADAAAVTVENTGDLAAGFQADIAADTGVLTAVSLTLGEAHITVSHTISGTDRLTIDTRPGHKGVWVNGVSALADTDYGSEFFPIPPGAHRLGFSLSGGGTMRMRLSIVPRYL